MKFSWSACLLAAASVTHAQYFSQGWQPGQRAAPTAVPIRVDSTFESEGSDAGGVEHAPPPPPPPPPPPTKLDLLSLFDLNTYLKSETSQRFFQSFGVNITDRLEQAQENPWDKRIPLITDDNYFDLIVNEPLSDEEAADRVWVICISATSGRQDGVSRFVDEAYDDAFNRTVVAGDLPHVRWGRIDYFSVTYLTTKWVVWQAPFLVVIKDRGQTLRFYRPQNLRMRDGAVREFLLADGWQVTAPWASAYAPGGDREYLMEYFAFYMAKFYNVLVRVPKFVLLLASGTVASFLIGFMHKKPASQKKKPTIKPPPLTTAVVPTPEAATTSVAASPASSSKGTKRKTKK